MSTEHEPVEHAEQAETIPAADVAVSEAEPYDEVAERAQAVAASQASIDAARPRDPRPSDVTDPAKMVLDTLADCYDRELARKPNLTPVALPLPAMARAAVAVMAGVPTVSPYDEHDTPRERFYDEHGAELDPEEYYVPTGVTSAGAMAAACLAVERVAGGVALPVRHSRDAEPERTPVLSVERAVAFALTILGAAYAPEPTPVDES